MAKASASKLSDAVSVSFSKASSSSRLDLDIPLIPLLVSDVDVGADLGADADAMRSQFQCTTTAVLVTETGRAREKKELWEQREFFFKQKEEGRVSLRLNLLCVYSNARRCTGLLQDEEWVVCVYWDFVKIFLRNSRNLLVWSHLKRLAFLFIFCCLFTLWFRLFVRNMCRTSFPSLGGWTCGQIPQSFGFWKALHDTIFGRSCVCALAQRNFYPCPFRVG